MNRYLLFLVLVCPCWAIQADENPLPTKTADLVVSVWPESPPKWKAPTEEEHDVSKADSRQVAGQHVIRLGFVSKPELHVYRANKANGDPSETVVMINPGGGYSILAWDLEGTEIAQWLQGIGVTAIVVKYRVPSRDAEVKWLPAVQDIQRGISLVRSGAIEGVAPKQIGVLGFSAGGNASGRVATADKRHYEPIDNHDEASVAADFAVLIYAAWLNSKDKPDELAEDISVTKNAPPTFLAVAQDDRKYCLSSVTMFRALNEKGVPASLHVFEKGGHGFGGRVGPADAWKGLCETWLQNQGWLNQ